MKTLVIYESKYGSTQKYAEEIAKRVEGDILPFKKVKFKKAIGEYDIIVFGAYTRGGKVAKIDEFLQNWSLMEGKAVIIFACGMSIPTAESRKELIETNVLNDYHLRFYQLRGRFNYSELRFPDNLIFNQSIKIVEQQDPSKATDLEYIKSNPIEVYDQEKVDYIVSVIQKIKIGEAQK